MLNDLNTSVANISPEQLDKLFDDAAPITAQDLAVGKQDAVKVETEETKNTVIADSSNNIPNIDIDSLQFADEANEEEEKKEEPAKVEAEAEANTEEAETKDEEETEEGAGDVSGLLKNSINYLVEKGIFKDFDGREDLEVDEETFAQLLEQQVAAKVEETYNEKKLSAGEYGQAILDYLEDGGDPDSIIDLFKERKEVQEFTLDSDESKAELISKWYKEVHGWKPERIKKHIDHLNADEELDTEAQEIKSKYDEHYKAQVDQMREEQAKVREAHEQRKKEFETSLSKAIETNKDFDDKRKRFIKDSIFKFKTLQDGTKVNTLYEKFAEIQSKPELYVEFAEWVLDREGYLKRREIEIQNKVTEKTFNFVKGNSALSTKKGSKHVEAKNEGKHTGTDFRVVFKNK